MSEKLVKAGMPFSPNGWATIDIQHQETRFTIPDLLEVLPKKIEKNERVYFLRCDFSTTSVLINYYDVKNKGGNFPILNKHLITALAEMVLLLVSVGFVFKEGKLVRG